MRHPRCERADDEHADRENGDDGLRSRVQQPIDTFRQLVRVGDEPVEESDRQDRQEPQQGDGARDCSPPPERLINVLGSPAAQPPGSKGGGNSEPEHEQSGFENEELHIVLIAETAPPVGHDVADAGCGQWNIVRHPRPGLRRINARERLQQARCEILSTDVLDAIDEFLDAQIGGVDLLLTSGQHPVVVGSVGPTSCYVVRLGWLTGGRRRPEQIQLVLGGRECRFKMLAKASNLAANALELVTEVVQFGIAQARLLKVALQPRKLLLPPSDTLLRCQRRHFCWHVQRSRPC